MSADEITVECPACEKKSMTVKSMVYPVPYFNELVIFMMKCSECGFTQKDIFSVEQRPPVRWELEVDDAELLKTRVIRSGSGTMRLPGFGIDVEPGPAAEAFISNVEGVVQRMHDVTGIALRSADTEEQQELGKEIMEKLGEALEGNLSFTLVIEDPAGVSAILPDDMTKVERRELSDEEASELRGAPFWLDNLRDEYVQQERKD
ncbi:MAG: ZPR1 zinc finger domain-containing protein [Candidatus Thorarchaeota archaeon]